MKTFIAAVKTRFRREPDPAPLFTVIANSPDPAVRRLAISIIGFRVLMEAYSKNPSQHQSYRELLGLIDELRAGIVAHHRQRCPCGAPVTSEMEMSLNGSDNLWG